MKLSKELTWIAPFLEEVLHLIPLERLTDVRGYRQRRDRNIGSYGGTHTADMLTYNITLLTHEWNKKKKKHVLVQEGMVLDTLAHELAHIVYWEHSWEHFNLQVRILHAWINVVREKDMKLWTN